MKKYIYSSFHGHFYLMFSLKNFFILSKFVPVWPPGSPAPFRYVTTYRHARHTTLCSLGWISASSGYLKCTSSWWTFQCEHTLHTLFTHTKWFSASDAPTALNEALMIKHYNVQDTGILQDRCWERYRKVVAYFNTRPVWCSVFVASSSLITRGV